MTLELFTVPHFVDYASRMVFDDGETREPEDWQIRFVADVFEGHRECWLIVPEGNGKTTFLAQLALYGADHTETPWIPIGAASRDQAKILYTQAAGFVERSDWLKDRFRCYDGYRKITSTKNGGVGIQVYAADVKTGDGVIPFPYAILDELHRQDDLRLYDLWKGKLKKRHAQILTISTAGEPETPFENTRDDIRRQATKRERPDGPCYLHAYGPGLAFHEYMVPSDEECSDMKVVKAANPLANLTLAELEEEFGSPTLDLGMFKRLKCNRPTRSVKTAITDLEWERAEVKRELPAGKHVDVGLDVAWKWDTTALVPLWQGQKYRLLGPTKVLVPPRDGSMLHPDEIKNAFHEVIEHNPIDTVVMDQSKAEDIAAWLEDELGLTVIDREQSNTRAVQDYEAFMEGLRNGTLKHTGDHALRTHVLNAIARRLPGGDRRFDRPAQTRRSNSTLLDRRVIDALTAAAMVVQHSTVDTEEKRSVYEDRGLVAA